MSGYAIANPTYELHFQCYLSAVGAKLDIGSLNRQGHWIGVVPEDDAVTLEEFGQGQGNAITHIVAKPPN